MLSHVCLFATPWTGAPQAPLSMGFSRQEYWSALPFPAPGDLLGPRIDPSSSLASPCPDKRILSTTEPPGKPRTRLPMEINATPGNEQGQEFEEGPEEAGKERSSEEPLGRKCEQRPEGRGDRDGLGSGYSRQKGRTAQSHGGGPELGEFREG